jgi:hypothetical protein
MGKIVAGTLILAAVAFVAAATPVSKEIRREAERWKRRPRPTPERPFERLRAVR